MPQAIDLIGMTAFPIASAAATNSSLSGTLFTPTLSPGDLSALSGATTLGTFGRSQIPWNTVAEWTHSLAKTPTDRWLDIVDGATRGPNHRWLHHHPIDFAAAWLTQDRAGPLQLGHYVRHIALDAITIKGLPLLPESAHKLLLSFGVPPSAIYNWTHLNVIDFSLGALSTGTGGYEFFLALTGNLPWNGMQTILVTFGAGALEIGAGLWEHNLLVVTGGMLKVAAGVLSLWQHMTAPAPTALTHLANMLPGLLAGVGGAASASALRLVLQWSSTTPLQRAGIVAETFSLGTTLSLLSCATLWASIPVGVAYSMGKLAFRFAKAENHFWERLPVSSALAIPDMLRLGGQSAVQEFDEYLTALPRFEQTADVAAFLNATPALVSVPVDAQHVFAQRATLLRT